MDLFHGTSRDIEGSILPRSIHKQPRGSGKTSWEDRPTYGAGQEYVEAQKALDDYYREHKAYATPNEHYAWNRFAHPTADRGGERGRVYEVEAPWDEDVDAGAFSGEYVANRFDITKQHDVKPGRQGTLPIDWRPHVLSRSQMDAANLHKSATADRWRGLNVWTKSGKPTDQFANHPEHYQEDWSRNYDRDMEGSEELRQRSLDLMPDPSQGSLFKESRRGRLKPRRGLA